MRTRQTNIYSNKLKSLIYNFFVKYYKVIILLALISLFAILTGVLTASKYASKLEIDNFINKTFANFIKNKSSVWSLFAKYLFNYLILCIVAIFLNIKPFCSIFNFVTIFIYSYSSIFDITVFIILFGMSGIIYGVFILVPFFLVLLFIYILISSIAIKGCVSRKKFGKLCDNNFSFIKVYTFLIAIAAILMIIECNLLNIMHYTIIAN